jgi:hypothetical protein
MMPVRAITSQGATPRFELNAANCIEEGETMDFARGLHDT